MSCFTAGSLPVQSKLHNAGEDRRWSRGKGPPLGNSAAADLGNCRIWRCADAPDDKSSLASREHGAGWLGSGVIRRRLVLLVCGPIPYMSARELGETRELDAFAKRS